MKKIKLDKEKHHNNWCWSLLNVNTISAIKRKDLNLAKEVINNFTLPVFLQIEIENIA